jgi:hypothetical protein
MYVYQAGATGASEGLTVFSERGVGTCIRVGAKGRLLVSGIPAGEVLRRASFTQISAPGRDGPTTFLTAAKADEDDTKALILTHFQSNGAHLEDCEIVATFANAFKLLKARPGATVWWYTGRIGHSQRFALHWRGGTHLPQYGAFEKVVPMRKHHVSSWTVTDQGSVSPGIRLMMGDRLKVSGVTVPIDPDVVRLGQAGGLTVVWRDKYGKLPENNPFIDPYGIGGPHNAMSGYWEVQVLWPDQSSPEHALVAVTLPKGHSRYFKTVEGYAWRLVEGMYRTYLVVLAPDTVIRYGLQEAVGQDKEDSRDFLVCWKEGVLTAGRADKIFKKAE